MTELRYLENMSYVNNLTFLNPRKFFEIVEFQKEMKKFKSIINYYFLKNIKCIVYLWICICILKKGK